MMKDVLDINEDLRVLLDHSPGGLFTSLWRKDGTRELKYVSPHFCEIVEMSLEELSGPTDPIRPLIHPDDQERMALENKKARASKGEWHQEFKLNVPSGTKLIEGFARFQQLDNGDVLWYGLFIDITNKKRTERAVLQREEIKALLEAVVELSPGGHYAIRRLPDGRSELMYASRKVQEVLGIDLNEFKDDARRMFEYIHPDDAGRFHAGRAEAIRKCENWRAEFRIRKQNGTEGWIELSIQPVAQQDGSVVWYGILVNIDQRKNLEMARQMAYDELKESEYRHRLLTENLESPVIIIDGEGTFHYANHAAEAFFDTARINLIGQRWPDTITPLEWEPRRKIIEKVLSENRKFADEVEVMVYGEQRFLRRMFIPIIAQGKPSKVLITIRDITSDVLLQKLLQENQPGL